MATMAKPGGEALSRSPFHSHTHLKDLTLFDFSARPNFTHSRFSHHLNVTVKHSRKPSILPIIRAQTQTSPGYVPDSKFYKVEAILRESMAGKLMHAVHYKNCGGGPSDLKYVEVPVPTPKKDEVLIKVEAASLSPIDWLIQQGGLKPMFPRELPQIPGTDVAGEVVDVGSGVKNVKAGDKVMAMLGFANGGGLAEFAVAKANLTVIRPLEVSAAEGAGIPSAGIMAHQALTDSAGLKLDGTGKPTNILITNASESVGNYAIQLAKLGNAHVTATCAPEHIDLVKNLGADEVVDQTTPDGQALKSPSGKKYDIVIHCGEPTSWSTFEPHLASNGKIFDVKPTPSSIKAYALKKLTFSKKQLIPVLLSCKAENMNFLVKLVKEGKVKTVIDSKYSLSNPEDAWAKNAENKIFGKIILEP